MSVCVGDHKRPRKEKKTSTLQNSLKLLSLQASLVYYGAAIPSFCFFFSFLSFFLLSALLFPPLSLFWYFSKTNFVGLFLFFFFTPPLQLSRFL